MKITKKIVKRSGKLKLTVVLINGQEAGTIQKVGNSAYSVFVGFGNKARHVGNTYGINWAVNLIAQLTGK